MEQNPLHLNELNDRLRIVQELVPGRQISLAHIIANPGKLLYQSWALTRRWSIRARPLVF